MLDYSPTQNTSTGQQGKLVIASPTGNRKQAFVWQSLYPLHAIFMVQSMPDMLKSNVQLLEVLWCHKSGHRDFHAVSKTHSNKACQTVDFCQQS